MTHRPQLPAPLPLPHRHPEMRWQTRRSGREGQVSASATPTYAPARSPPRQSPVGSLQAHPRGPCLPGPGWLRPACPPPGGPTCVGPQTTSGAPVWLAPRAHPVLATRQQARQGERHPRTGPLLLPRGRLPAQAVALGEPLRGPPPGERAEQLAAVHSSPPHALAPCLVRNASSHFPAVLSTEQTGDFPRVSQLPVGAGGPAGRAGIPLPAFSLGHHGLKLDLGSSPKSVPRSRQLSAQWAGLGPAVSPRDPSPHRTPRGFPGRLLAAWPGGGSACAPHTPVSSTGHNLPRACQTHTAGRAAVLPLTP